MANISHAETALNGAKAVVLGAWTEGWWEIQDGIAALLAPILGARKEAISLHQNVTMASAANTNPLLAKDSVAPLQSAMRCCRVMAARSSKNSVLNTVVMALSWSTPVGLPVSPIFSIMPPWGATVSRFMPTIFKARLFKVQA